MFPFDDAIMLRVYTKMFTDMLQSAGLHFVLIKVFSVDELLLKNVH